MVATRIFVPSLMSASVWPTEYTSYRLGSMPGQMSGRRSEKSSSASSTRSGGSAVSISVSTLGIGFEPEGRIEANAQSGNGYRHGASSGAGARGAARLLGAAPGHLAGHRAKPVRGVFRRPDGGRH